MVSVWLCSALLTAALWPTRGHAWTVTVSPGQRRLFMQVGVGNAYANNSTRNTVSVTVPVAAVGNGVAQRFNSDSTQARSSLSNDMACDLSQQQVYVAAAFRAPASVSNSAQLRVSAPAQLVSPNGLGIPISEVFWESTHLSGGVNIPSRTLSAGNLPLATIAPNRWLESCLSFYFRNNRLRAGGTYTATATFTISAP